MKTDVVGERAYGRLLVWLCIKRAFKSSSFIVFGADVMRPLKFALFAGSVTSQVGILTVLTKMSLSYSDEVCSLGLHSTIDSTIEFL